MINTLTVSGKPGQVHPRNEVQSEVRQHVEHARAEVCARSGVEKPALDILDQQGEVKGVTPEKLSNEPA